MLFLLIIVTVAVIVIGLTRNSKVIMYCWQGLCKKCITEIVLILLDAFAGLGMAAPDSAFTTMVTTFGLAGIVGK